MSAQPVRDRETGGPQEVLDAVVRTGWAVGRPGLPPLPGAQGPPHGSRAIVQVTRGTQQGGTAVVTALLHALAHPGLVFTETATEAVCAALFVATAARPLTVTDLDRVHELQRRGPAVLLVLVEIDLRPDWAGMLATDLALLRGAGVAVEPFPVSTRLHARAAVHRDRDLESASGVPALAGRLREIADRPDATAHALPHRVLRTVPGPGPGTGPRPRRAGRARTVEPDTSGGSERARWQQALGDGFAAVSSDVDFDLRTRVRAVLAEAEQVVDRTDPGRDWPEVQRWLHERLAYETGLAYALLTERSAEVAATLAGHVGGPLRPVPPPEPPDLQEGLPSRDLPTATGRPLAARGRTLVMSGYGGLMMALLLPRLADLRLPLWLLLGSAALAAALMGAAALSGERKHRLDGRRNRAKTLVRACTDDVALVAGKHLRDAVRRAHQHLRDECSARAPDTPRPAAAAASAGDREAPRRG